MTDAVAHDLHPAGLLPARPLPRPVGLLVWAGLAASAVFGASIVLALWEADRSRRAVAVLAERTRAAEREAEQSAAEMARLQRARREAESLDHWLSLQGHAQSLLLNLLSHLPAGAGLESLEARLAEGVPQVTLVLSFQGGGDDQRAALDALERGLFSVAGRIAAREQSSDGSGTAGRHRLVVNLPPGGRWLP